MKAKYYYKDGTIFEGDRLDAPHRTDPSKVLHREDGPAAENSDRHNEWWLNGRRHREDGPAAEWSNGDKVWYQNGKLHRENGPAVDWMSGSREWHLNGECHREDGPAEECGNGTKRWWLKNKRYCEKEFNNILKEVDSLDPAVGLLDPREWVRNRWKRKLENEM